MLFNKKLVSCYYITDKLKLPLSLFNFSIIVVLELIDELIDLEIKEIQ